MATVEDLLKNLIKAMISEDDVTYLSTLLSLAFPNSSNLASY